MGGSKRAAQNVEKFIRDNLPGAVSARTGKKRAPLRDTNWSRTSAEEIRDMMGTDKGRATLSELSPGDKKTVRDRLVKQNRLWADQFDDVVEGAPPGRGYDPKRDAPKRLDSGKETAPPKGGNNETDMSDRAKDSIGKKLKREGKRNEKEDVSNTGKALRGTKEARADAEKPLPNPRYPTPTTPARATPLELDPPLQRGNAAGSTPGSDTIAVEGGTKPLPKGKPMRKPDDIDGLGEPETFVRDEEIDPNENAPKRKARTVTAGEGDSMVQEKVSEPETRARGTRVSKVKGEIKTDGDFGKQGGRSSAFYRNRATSNAAGFNPNAAERGKRLSPDEVAESQIDLGGTYKRMEGRNTQTAEDRYADALRSVRSNYPEEHDSFLALIADASNDETAYEVAYRLAEGAVDNDMPGVRISETARADAVHGMAAALVRGNGREIPATMPRYVAELDDAARRADIESGHITAPTKAPVEPGPQGSVRDFLRNRAQTRFRPDADGRPKVGAESGDDGFGLKDADVKEDGPGTRAPTAGSTESQTLAPLPPKPGATPVRTRKGKPAAATEPGVNPAALEGSEDAQPVWADRTALRRAGAPLPPRRTKAQKAAEQAAAADDGLDPVPEGGVTIPPRGKPVRQLRSDGTRDEGLTTFEPDGEDGFPAPTKPGRRKPKVDPTFTPDGTEFEGTDVTPAATSPKPTRTRRAPVAEAEPLDVTNAAAQPPDAAAPPAPRRRGGRRAAPAAEVSPAPEQPTIQVESTSGPRVSSYDLDGSSLPPTDPDGIGGVRVRNYSTADVSPELTPEGLGRDFVDDDPFVAADGPDEVPVGNPWVTTAGTRAEYHGPTPEELGRRAREAAANQPPPRPLDARRAGRWVGERLNAGRLGVAGGGGLLAAYLMSGSDDVPDTGPDVYTLSDGPVRQQPQQADLDQILQAIRQMQGARNSVYDADVPVNRRVGTYGYANNGY